MVMKIRDTSGRTVEVKPNIIDRVVNFFDAERGTRRLKARAHSAAIGGYGGYNGGKRDRRSMRNWRFKETDADTAMLPDLPDLRARSDELMRNAPIATGAIATAITNSIGTGLQLQSSIDPQVLGVTPEQADAMEREQEQEWSLFCKSCDFTGVQIFEEMQPTAFRSVLVGGDLLIVRRYRKDAGDVYGTKLQMVTAARVSNPDRAADTDKIIAGVEYDKDGRPLAFHISDRHPGNLRGQALTWERLPSRTPAGKQLVIHLFDRMMPDQSRGLPYLSPVIELLKTMGDYTDGEVSAAVLASYFTVFVKNGEDSDENPSVGERSAGDDLNDNETKLGKGAIINLGQDESIEVANPGRPNANFDPFMQAILRQVGVALELPFELLIKHFTASYSAARASLEMGWQFFRRQRVWLARRYCQVSYEWMMDEAVASGRLNRPGYFEDALLRQAYLGSVWIGPPRISLDPEKEARADSIDINENKVKTREMVVLERIGGRIENNIRQLGKEQRQIEVEGLPAAAGAQQNGNKAQAADNTGNDTETGDNQAQQQRGTS